MKPYGDTGAKGEQVGAMFDSIAPRYDFLNRALSLGTDRYWRRKAVKAICTDKPCKVLDVATGTADLAAMTAVALPGAMVVGIDISEEMLALGRKKIAARGLSDRVSLQRGDATRIDFPEGEFDVVSVAFGVRNFDDLEKGIAEMHRVLRRGGRVVVLEFSIPRVKIFSALYRFYFHRILPLVGGIVSGDGKAYRYLPLSVDEFPSPDEFLRLLERTGFGDCRARVMTFGTAYLYTGIKR